MKIVCQRERLHSALQLVASVVGPSTAKPVLQDVKLEAAGDSLGLVTTDLEVGVRYHLSDVEVAAEGAALVPAKRLSDIVRNASDETMELEWSDSVLTVRGHNSQFRVLGEDPEEFPGVPEVEAEGGVALSGQVLATLLDKTVFAAASQSTRYTLNGVFVELEGKKILLTATDGHRLAHVEHALSAAVSAAAGGIVPQKAAALLQRSVAPDDEVLLQLGENDILARTERLTVYARLLEGTFPRYREVIPAEAPAKLKAPTRELEQCVRQAAVLTSDESRAVRFHIEKDHLTLRSRTPEAGEATVEMAVEYAGEPIVIGFNPRFIADALDPIVDETVQMEVSAADRPGVVKDGKGYLCVLMPLSLTDEVAATQTEG